MSVRNGVTVRGTSNRNARGSAEGRRRRRAWLVEAYRADVDLLEVSRNGRVTFTGIPINQDTPADVWAANGPLIVFTRACACRCYRCGELLTVNTVTVDRIIPGCLGGTYRRDNIRPACGPCNSETGGALTGQGAKRRVKS